MDIYPKVELLEQTTRLSFFICRTKDLALKAALNWAVNMLSTAAEEQGPAEPPQPWHGCHPVVPVSSVALGTRPSWNHEPPLSALFPNRLTSEKEQGEVRSQCHLQISYILALFVVFVEQVNFFVSLFTSEVCFPAVLLGLSLTFPQMGSGLLMAAFRAQVGHVVFS